MAAGPAIGDIRREIDARAVTAGLPGWANISTIAAILSIGCDVLALPIAARPGIRLVESRQYFLHAWTQLATVAAVADVRLDVLAPEGGAVLADFVVTVVRAEAGAGIAVEVVSGNADLAPTGFRA
jgi:hypothetical protein